MKNHIIGGLTAISLLLAPTANAAETYKLDPAHTNIVWYVNHFGFSNPSGKFTKTEGTLELDEKKPENSKLEVTIYTAHLITGIEKLDEHLKNKDFLDVEKFPTAVFKSTKVEVTGKDTAKVTGDFTLHGVTKPVVLDVKMNKIGENMKKVKTAGFSAISSFKRSDYGIKTYLPDLADNVELSIEAEANIPAPETVKPVPEPVKLVEPVADKSAAENAADAAAKAAKAAADAAEKKN